MPKPLAAPLRALMPWVKVTHRNEAAYILQQWSYSCAPRQSAVLSLVRHLANGEVEGSRSYDKESVAYESGFRDPLAAFELPSIAEQCDSS